VIARVIHVIAVDFWIGGVAFVTAVLVPALRKLPSHAERIEVFDRLESRFAAQARVTTLLAGASGL
jgi:uncharacterized membrane protein